MKAYCMNCGHPNEYSGAIPKKCEKCGTEFSVARVEFKVNLASKDSVTPMRELIQEQLDDSEFDSFMQGSVEPMSQDEIKGIFLKDADRGINLKDLMAEAAKEPSKKTPKLKKRTPRRRK